MMRISKQFYVLSTLCTACAVQRVTVIYDCRVQTYSAETTDCSTCTFLQIRCGSLKRDSDQNTGKYVVKHGPKYLAGLEGAKFMSFAQRGEVKPSNRYQKTRLRSADNTRKKIQNLNKNAIYSPGVFNAKLICTDC